jgi:hypothetical protein
MTPRPILAFLLAVALLTSLPAAGRERVELIPEEVAALNAGTAFAPLTGFFLGGPGYWYRAREIEIDSVPPGAVLDLFYVRASFQKAYEQADAPITLVLPSRSQAGPRDSITIRALLDGYQQSQVRVPVRSRTKKVVVELEPLANSLLAVTHRHLVGRGTLAFLTKEALTFRIQERDDGLSLVLVGTGMSPEASGTIAGVSSSLVVSLREQQVGQDLMIRVVLQDAASESTLRSRQSHDPVRGIHTFAIDLVPADGGVEAVHLAKAALARIGRADVSGCALAFDASLREQLEPAALNRALAPDGSFTDPFLRAAMKRLGELSPDGMVTLVDGSSYRTSAAIELMAASSQGAQVKGYLAMLRAFVAESEPPAGRRSALRGLAAPELGVEKFDAIADTAEERERSCRAGESIDGAEQL